MTNDSVSGVLLVEGTFYGTLAAARCYGRAGIPVILADSRPLTQTRWSRFVSKTVRMPPVTKVDTFLDWLVDFGRNNPGLFLYSTTDDMSWVFASRAEELSKVFTLYQPPLSAIVQLLDKRRLLAACELLGIDAPRTYFPETDAQLRELAQTVPMPLLVKPRTQMLLQSKSKGYLCSDRADLVAAYERFRAANTYGDEVLRFDPTIARPMLQAYHPEAMVDTYSLSGFIDQTGDVFVVRGARKVFQRPRQLGVGLCFKGLPVIPKLKDQIHRLARHVGYYGAFETEFVHIASTGQHLLIDFNPRFYGQMGFEVARDMPLPTLVYHAARGLAGDDLLRAAGHKDPSEDDYHFANRWVLELVMLTQSLSGRLRREDRRALQQMLHDPNARYVDAVRERADAGPFVADLILNMKHFARHPRDFVTKFFLDA